MTPPTILEGQPKPQLIKRLFHGHSIDLWEGRVKISAVKGWVGNPRIDDYVNRFRDSHANEDPNQDEIMTMMESREFKLKELSDDIRINGVRTPIILTASGKLLDGNRRFFATKFLLKHLDADAQLTHTLKSIPAWVLSAEADAEQEERILVQENFYPPMKLEWQHYVKAKRIYSELKNGMAPASVAKKYNWNKSTVNDTKKIMELIDDFIAFATEEPGDDGSEGLGWSYLEAENKAAEYYQYFNEAKKSILHELNADADFKCQFFRWLVDDKFSSFPEVRVLGKVWHHPEARRILEGDDPKAAKHAKALIDYEDSGAKNLKNAEEVIAEFTRYLLQMTTKTKKDLPDATVAELAKALKTVLAMVKKK